MFRPFKRFSSKRDKKHDSGASSSHHGHMNGSAPLAVADSGGMVMLNGKGSSKSCTTLPSRPSGAFNISDPVVLRPKSGTLPTKNGMEGVKMRSQSGQQKDSAHKRRSWFHLSGSSKSLGNYNYNFLLTFIIMHASYLFFS